jgi:hypothetical protein
MKDYVLNKFYIKKQYMPYGLFLVILKKNLIWEWRYIEH